MSAANANAASDYSGTYALLRFDGEPATMHMKLSRGTTADGSPSGMYYCSVTLGKKLRGRLHEDGNILRGTFSASRVGSTSRQLKMERIFKAAMEEGCAVTFNEAAKTLSLESDSHLWEFEQVEETTSAPVPAANSTA